MQRQPTLDLDIRKPGSLWTPSKPISPDEFIALQAAGIRRQLDFDELVAPVMMFGDTDDSGKPTWYLHREPNVRTEMTKEIWNLQDLIIRLTLTEDE